MKKREWKTQPGKNVRGSCGISQRNEEKGKGAWGKKVNLLSNCESNEKFYEQKTLQTQTKRKGPIQAALGDQGVCVANRGLILCGTIPCQQRRNHHERVILSACWVYSCLTSVLGPLKLKLFYNLHRRRLESSPVNPQNSLDDKR
ncbi:uncharacterized protein LOC112493788 [Cephus cinctus]|uniref:Uncharacterized protein LOC112493788 n=1 Tax=Cephus cinctus TaxID=211228 RepID=A0AAJ7R9A4_CEPCN|nr:uncharacterized protein LOC112493788 [Cephus cinctus]